MAFSFSANVSLFYQRFHFFIQRIHSFIQRFLACVQLRFPLSKLLFSG